MDLWDGVLHVGRFCGGFWGDFLLQVVGGGLGGVLLFLCEGVVDGSGFWWVGFCLVSFMRLSG